MALDRNGLEILSRQECLRLLKGWPVGRVGVTRHALPMVLPVTYRLSGEDIFFATGTGSKSLAVAHRDVIAFEVDQIDPETKTGWSVLAVGVAHHVKEDDPEWELTDELDLQPWVGGQAIQLIRLPTDRLTGRRLLGSGTPASNWLG